MNNKNVKTIIIKTFLTLKLNKKNTLIIYTLKKVLKKFIKD